MIAPLPPLLLRGDCLVELARIPDASVDAVVTDPPYGLDFMGKDWDKYTPLDFELWCAKWAAECLRILKPGGHLLAFGGSRTWHRLAAGIEDAGFEIRDSIAWLYGSGFPKSLDVSKAIDKAAGATREKVRKTGAASAYSANAGNDRPWMQEARENGFIEVDGDVPATDAVREWEGWGTALKPAFEPVVVARKPLGEKTVAANVLAHGTGALNIDATRIPSDDGYEKAWDRPVSTSSANVMLGGLVGPGRKMVDLSSTKPSAGRWPANVALDESQAAALDAQSGTTKSRSGKRNAPKDAGTFGAYAGDEPDRLGHSDTGGASRFFYVAKAPKSERPAFEPVVVARKPLGEKTVAANVLAHGTGALNIDATRIATTDDLSGNVNAERVLTNEVYGKGLGVSSGRSAELGGRWPANVALDESQAAVLDTQSGTLKTGGNVRTRNADASRAVLGAFNGQPDMTPTRPGDSGGASRFFYVAKAPKSERPIVDGTAHPTVKPLALMRWLIRLVTPPGGCVVDPFAGSGTTLEAAYLEGFESIGVEMTPEYWPLIAARIERVTR